MQQDIEGLYRQHRQGLFTLALSITRCPELAEDAVHDACARLMRFRPKPHTDRAAYVFTAVRNAALDLARRRRPTVPYPVSLFDERGCDPAAAASNAEQQRRVREAVDKLPLDQREAVVLRLYANLTFEQIAETLGEPLQTVASRYRRALDRIRQAMEETK